MERQINPKTKNVNIENEKTNKKFKNKIDDEKLHLVNNNDPDSLNAIENLILNNFKNEKQSRFENLFESKVKSKKAKSSTPIHNSLIKPFLPSNNTESKILTTNNYILTNSNSNINEIYSNIQHNPFLQNQNINYYTNQDNVYSSNHNKYSLNDNLLTNSIKSNYQTTPFQNENMHQTRIQNNNLPSSIFNKNKEFYKSESILQNSNINNVNKIKPKEEKFSDNEIISKKNKHNHNDDEKEQLEDFNLKFLTECNNLHIRLTQQSFSRKVQTIIVKKNTIVENILVPKLKDFFLKLSMNKFANYTLQLMIDYMSDDSICLLFNSVIYLFR